MQTINQHMLGAGEPIRVKRGQRVLMHLLNASGTENVVFALPGHTFKVIAMDRNPVPNPVAVDVLSIAVAERVDAIVEMNSPGMWVLGSTLAKSRAVGLGIVVEYAGATGTAVWRDPASAEWDYSLFAHPARASEPDETFTLTFRDIRPMNGSRFDSWTINNQSWPKIDSLHLHRHTFEVTRVGTKEFSGLRKDVVNVMPLDSVAVDFLADNPGNTLLHCHQALRMDFGFMQLMRYVG